MELTGRDRDARLRKTDVLQRQVTPAAGHLADFQTGDPAVRRLQHQVQAAGRADQERDRPQQQNQKDQYPEAYLLP